MLYKDYKFWFIRRDDNGFIIEAGIDFYEGEYKNVLNSLTGITKNTYIRTRRLTETDLVDLKPKIIKRLDKSQSIRYVPEDFGKIKTDDELRLFLNKQLAKISDREAIAEQKWQL